MKITAFRETIAGIEVVDAEFADSLLTAIVEVIDARNAYHGASHARQYAREIFGAQSDEFLLWTTATKSLTKKYKKCRKVLKGIVEASQGADTGDP